MPKFYSWNVSSKLWNRRKRGREIETGVFETDTIGRIYTVSLKQGDCFNLRLLLLSVPGPTMQAVSVSQFPHCLRNLFAVLLTQTNPSQPLELWMKFQSQLIEDYLQQLHISVDDAKNMALLSIRNTLHAIDGSDLQFYGLPVPTNVVVERFDQDYTKEVCYNIEHQHEIASGNRNKLTTEQLDIFHAIEGKINEKVGGLILLDAPRGCGKTFLIETLLASQRAKQHIVIATASTGLAATLLPGGRTVHSIFKVSININTSDSVTCAIKKGTALSLNASGGYNFDN